MDEPGVVVITGGAGGVGLATARRLARSHAVVIADLHASALEAAAAELDANVTPVVCDVTAPDAVAHLVAVAGALGPVRRVVHASGLSPSMADARTILSVNLVGTAIVLDAFLPAIAPGGCAVCVASISGHRASLGAHDALLADPRDPGFLERVAAGVSLERPGVGYALSKRGVLLLCEQRAHDWAARDARLVSVSPGLIATPMGELERAAGAKRLESTAAITRPATAEEIAAAIDFLSGPDAGFITGVDLKVDGGAIAGFAHRAQDAVRDQWNDPWYADDPWTRSGQD